MPLLQHSRMASQASGPSLSEPPLICQPLETIRGHNKAQTPACSYQPKCSKQHRISLGGIGIIDPTQLTASHYTTSKNVSAPLVSLILQQSTSYPTYCKQLQRKAKSDGYQARRQHETTCTIDLFNKIPRNQLRAVEASKEKGALSWLSSLPVAEHGFALHKGAFRDALCLRYGWRPPHLISNCVCGKQYTIEQALSCAVVVFLQLGTANFRT